jgi:hypothetical protein
MCETPGIPAKTEPASPPEAQQKHISPQPTKATKNHAFSSAQCEAPAELMLDRKTRLGRSLALPLSAYAIALCWVFAFRHMAGFYLCRVFIVTRVEGISTGPTGWCRVDL